MRKKRGKAMNSYKGYSLEELRRMRIISNTDGRPNPSLTDDKWQVEFYFRKMFVKPYPPNIRKMSVCTNRGYETTQTYSGEFQYKRYSMYINDVLKTIRKGKVDYCYFIYQIMDILKFHYNDLRTKYIDDYWEVWLEK